MQMKMYHLAVLKMIDLKQNTLLREIPPNLLVDNKVVHLAIALQIPLSEMLEWAEKINYKMNLDNLDESIIDHLLWENHITWDEGLNLAKTKEQKIQLIKSAIALHRLKGTPAAIEKVLEALQLPGKVTEWFEYGGNPYHFKVQINLDEYFSRDFDINQLRRLIDANKNVRSWLEIISLKGYVLVPQIFKHNNFVRIQINTSSNPWAFAGATGDGVEKILINGKYLLNGERHLNSFIKTNGPAYVSDTRLVMNVVHDFGVHDMNVSPILDGEYHLNGEILLQNELQNIRLAVRQEARLNYKQHKIVHLEPKQNTNTFLKTKTTSGVNTLNGAQSLGGNISLNQTLFEHSGLFRVKKSGITIEEVAM